MMCHVLAQDKPTFASGEQKDNIMKKTNNDNEKLVSVISSEYSLNALADLIGDFGLEITSIEKKDKLVS